MEPGIHGLEPSKRIQEYRPGQKAIITSGIYESDRVKEAQRIGAGAYIKKPYIFEKIALAVRNELNKKSQSLNCTASANLATYRGVL